MQHRFWWNAGFRLQGEKRALAKRAGTECVRSQHPDVQWNCLEDGIGNCCELDLTICAAINPFLQYRDEFSAASNADRSLGPSKRFESLPCDALIVENVFLQTRLRSGWRGPI
jgi:hypothetical protein